VPREATVELFVKNKPLFSVNAVDLALHDTGQERLSARDIAYLSYSALTGTVLFKPAEDF
jgi:hypothetical protein